MPKVQIKNRENLDLVIFYQLPNHVPAGLIFIEHGFTGHCQETQLKIIADCFSEHSYIVVLFDATNSTGESGCSLQGVTFTGHYHDLEDVINWAKTQPWFIEPFVVSGHSLGASAAIYYTENHPEDVKLLLGVSPVIKGSDFYEATKKAMGNAFEQWEQGGFYKRCSKTTGKTINVPFSYMTDFLKYNAEKLSHKIQCRTILISGDKDASAPLASIKNFYEKLTCPKELNILKDCGHIFHAPKDLEKLKSTVTRTLNYA